MKPASDEPATKIKPILGTTAILPVKKSHSMVPNMRSDAPKNLSATLIGRCGKYNPHKRRQVDYPQKEDLVPYFSSRSKHTELMQYRFPVGVGPSSKTCPKCEPQRAHVISVLSIPNVPSRCCRVASGSAASKEGQPVPESNFASDEKSALPHALHS